MPTVHLLIKGKVQGVFFRATAKDIAKENGITGWIKNTKEGDVEAMISGSQEQVDMFIKWCRTGPGRAVVTEVIVTSREHQPFAGFNIGR